MVILELEGVSQSRTSKEVKVSALIFEQKRDTDHISRVLRVTITNRTDTLASFYESWNLWGHDAVAIELNVHDTIFCLSQSCNSWDKNFPSSVMLFPGDSIHFDFDIVGCGEQKCRCFYTSPNRLTFPKYNLRGASLRVLYQVNLENHFQEVARTLEARRENKLPFFVGMFPVSHRKVFEKLSLNQKLRSFVKSELVSKPITLDFPSW